MNLNLNQMTSAIVAGCPVNDRHAIRVRLGRARTDNIVWFDAFRFNNSPFVRFKLRVHVCRDYGSEFCAPVDARQVSCACTSVATTVASSVCTQGHRPITLDCSVKARPASDRCRRTGSQYPPSWHGCIMEHDVLTPAAGDASVTSLRTIMT